MMTKLRPNQQEKARTESWSLSQKPNKKASHTQRDPSKAKVQPKTKLTQFSKLLSYLLIFLLPTQLGIHFWPNFSLLLGIRVDYLSPTLYVTDVVILSLIVINARQSWSNDKKIHIPSKTWLLFWLILMSGTLMSGNI